MPDVIRPTFGRRPGSDASPECVGDYSPLEIYGTAVGHFVGLIRVGDPSQDRPLQVIVGRDGSGAAEAVAAFPDTGQGEVDASVTAHAILRALAIVRSAIVD